MDLMNLESSISLILDLVSTSRVQREMPSEKELIKNCFLKYLFDK